MIKQDIYRDAPAAARYHPQAIEEIIQSVDERIYSVLLGPRLCGKTLLLRFIESNLAPALGWTCVYVDLKELRTTTQHAFFEDLIQLVRDKLVDLTGINLPLPQDEGMSSVVFRGFLTECLDVLGRDLVLLIDPLEALPVDLVQALLTSLRAAYMDQQNMDYQVTVVVSGALSLATLTVGESSPFRGIARRVFVGDLSASDSRSLIEEMFAEEGISASRPAINKLLLATQGDVYLIRRLSQRSIELANGRMAGFLRTRDVNRVTDRFLRNEVLEYAPLIEAIRMIEEDPDLLECILRLLRQELIPKSELPLPLSPDLDPLFLTGMVERVDGDQYRLQNLIYKRFLGDYFTPARVGHVLAMAGRWDASMTYLESSIYAGSLQARQDLLPAAINSMYAAQNLALAVHFLQRALSAAFNVTETQVWLRMPHEKHLRLTGFKEPGLNTSVEAERDIELAADRLEARAFRYQVPLRGQEANQRIIRAIPLKILGHQPVGVVTIFEMQEPIPSVDPRERDLQMVGFLNQAARALQTVSMRRQELTLAGRVQASLLPESSPQVPGWQVAAWWKPALETSGDFYDFIPLPYGRLGIVIADVVDKGMGAALMMTLSRTLLRSYAVEHSGQPAHLLEVVNQRILADLEAGLFVTLFYGVLDPASGRLTYVNAGHPPPYLVTPGQGHEPELLFATGMPLGVDEGTTWEYETVQLKPGDTLVCYTDGILDAQNERGSFFGETQFLAMLQGQAGLPAQSVIDTTMNSLYAFTKGQPQVDDITLVVLKRNMDEAL